MDQSLPKNSIRLADFEVRINSLEEKTGKVNSTISEDTEKMKELKNQMQENKDEIATKLKESNDEIEAKLREQFQKDIEYGENLYTTNIQGAEQLEKEIEELHNKIFELENNSNTKLTIYRKKQKELDDLKHQYELLKESYDDAAKENMSLRKDLDTRNLNINGLESEIEDLKIVISKLIDSRKILNKFFATHYENFTEEEKKLIQEIEGNVFPGYYNNNPNMPDLNNNENQFMDNKNINQNLQSESNDLVNLRESGNLQGNGMKILNEQEYGDYQKKIRNRASA
jgi:chromosome segregation ATPase